MSAATAGKLLPILDEVPAAFILGRDDTNKPHAAWFSADQVEGAKNAAAMMGMHLVIVGGDPTFTDMIAGLPRGKLFASGKAFCPFVAAATFEKLLPYAPAAGEPKKLRVVASAATGGEDMSKPPAAPAKGAIDLPKDWSAIKVGSVVLASESRDDGWWEAKVTEAKPNDVFILKWVDYPDYEPFVRHRERLALMFPRPFAS
jgi:hypothetical protein